MMTMQDNAIVVLRPRRDILVARVNDDDRYRALLVFQVRPAIAAAVVARLITISLSA